MKSYFTFLGRNKLYTAIQFFGLAIALGVVILLTSYADTEFNIGNNQPYSHQLYAVGYGIVPFHSGNKRVDTPDPY